MSQLATYSQHLAGLIDNVDSDDFPRELVATLRELVPVDDATVILYPETELPVIEYFEVPATAERSTLDNFVKGAFLLDPYYLAGSSDGLSGVFRLRDLSPQGFKESEYYKTWYRSCGYQDECGFIIPVSETGFVNVALGKTAARASFTRRECELLQDVYPAVAALARKHWALRPVQDAGVNLRAQLHSALESFGRSLLTERETQVINLVLHGHSTKTVADKLSISMETVKLHRKHAYAKLEVSSQAELFYLFLDSLMSAQDYSGGDTLIAYLQPPPRPAKKGER
ncbi:LuxR family transcriptional regulator [Mangrovimicrobium sediminis]|uniref:LuxR family transcriptional regulator n=1 Tax=Mangrovimicrobium sediminis TaxID=2562682 RepID=A0A4Z0LWV7_9GAMM|nr:LuxR C-terminal-related transcriptional regulator [Haliea sp. SAOS-164]TGD71704.1 LuxR family transcriptional regulator [Haliea sp. SAOS-164]